MDKGVYDKEAKDKQIFKLSRRENDLMRKCCKVEKGRKKRTISEQESRQMAMCSTAD